MNSNKMFPKILIPLFLINLCGTAMPYLGNGVKVGEVDQNSAIV